jgi:hypothetical protein
MKTLWLRLALLISALVFIPTSYIGAQKEDETIADAEIKVVDFQDLQYPPLARVARIQGIVVVRAMLDDNGNVVGATAISGRDVLIPDCLANVKKWHFLHNRHKMVIVVYNFDLPNDSLCNPPASIFQVRGNFATITSCQVPTL